MHKDIPSLLKKNKINGLLAMDSSQDNPNFKYATCGARLRGYFLYTSTGKTAILYGEMERANIPAIENIHTTSYTELFQWIKKNTAVDAKVKKLSKNGAAPSSSAALAGAFLQKNKFKGTIALSGKVEAGFAVEFAKTLGSWSKDIKVDLTSCASNILKLARATKTDEEIEIIAQAGKVTEGAIQKARTFLKTCHIKDGLVYDTKNKKVTLGTIRNIIEQTLALGSMDCPETPIVSQGRDAAVPHNTGDNSAHIRAHVPIVLDIFPRKTASGYFFDTTRTICVGTAPKELKTFYSHVLKAQKACIEFIREGVKGSDVEKIALDLFEGWGHETLRSNPGTTKGFCHGLGHGLGMDLHEWPNVNSSWNEKLKRGSVVTVEPGVYYEEKETGIRIEDVVAIMSDGTVRNLCKGSKALEIKIPEK